MTSMLLTIHEHEFLIEMLERMHKSLMEELVHTEDAEYRDYVKERVQMATALLQKLKTGSSLAFVTGQELPA